MINQQKREKMIQSIAESLDVCLLDNEFNVGNLDIAKYMVNCFDSFLMMKASEQSLFPMTRINTNLIDGKPQTVDIVDVETPSTDFLKLTVTTESDISDMRSGNYVKFKIFEYVGGEKHLQAHPKASIFRIKAVLYTTMDSYYQEWKKSTLSDSNKTLDEVFRKACNKFSINFVFDKLSDL